MSSRVSQKSANKVAREEMARARRRRRTRITAIGAVVAVVVAGLIGWAVYAAQSSKPYETPANAAGKGLGLSVAHHSGKPTVEVFADFLCPNCKIFEQDAGPTLNQLIADKKISLVYHPVSMLDTSSTTNYSTRSASAAACASDLGKFNEFSQALFGQQPAEGGAGLTDDEIIQIGASVGLADPTFAKCVRNGTYRTWVAHITDEAVRKGVKGTPTVFVNGRMVQASKDSITAAINSSKK